MGYSEMFMWKLRNQPKFYQYKQDNFAYEISNNNPKIDMMKHRSEFKIKQIQCLMKILCKNIRKWSRSNNIYCEGIQYYVRDLHSKKQVIPTIDLKNITIKEKHKINIYDYTEVYESEQYYEQHKNMKQLLYEIRIKGHLNGTNIIENEEEYLKLGLLDEWNLTEQNMPEIETEKHNKSEFAMTVLEPSELVHVKGYMNKRKDKQELNPKKNRKCGDKLLS